MDKAVDLVKMLAGTMSERCVPQNGDYIKDGLLYCGKCNTPTEYRMIFHGEEIVFPIWCDCMRAAADERDRQSAEAQRSIRAAELRRLSLMSGKLSECTFANADGKAGFGFTKTEAAKLINWIICPRNVPIAVSKTDGVKIFDPATTQGADAWTIEYRKFHDLWVKNKQLPTIRVSVAE